jgi:hypothetical protein
MGLRASVSILQEISEEDLPRNRQDSLFAERHRGHTLIPSFYTVRKVSGIVRPSRVLTLNDSANADLGAEIATANGAVESVA